MKLIPRWLKDNFLVKIGMFFLAVLLWFLVVSEKNYDYYTNAPISIIGLEQNETLIHSAPSTARVRFHARGRELLRLIYVNKPHIVVDLGYSPSAKAIKLKPEMVVIPGGIPINAVEIISPDSIPVGLDRLIEVSVPVKPDLELSLDPGFSTVGGPIVEPSKITISGPESSLRKFASISTEPVILGGLHQTTSAEAKLLLPDNYRLTASERQVKLTVKVERLGEKSVECDSLPIRSVPTGRTALIEPQSVRVHLTGPVSLLAGLTPKALKYWVDWADNHPDKPGWLPVHIIAPEGIEVRGVTPSNVRVVLRKL